jgi:hypothetical protein
MTGTVYGSGQIRRRRSHEEMERLRRELLAIVSTHQPLTVRSSFYQASVAGLIAKEEREYKNVIVRLLKELRLSGAMPFSWITDATRWMRAPQTFDSLEDALFTTARTYRRSVWHDQPTYIEVWCEKNAVAGVLSDVTMVYDVPLMAAVGFSSLTFLHSSAEQIADRGKPTYVYYFGDHDPSGVTIDRQIEKRLREFAPHAEIHFERIAVTPEQIERWNLPTRPTKKTDSRSKGFVGESVELDAIPAGALRALARGAIEQHISPSVLQTLQVVEDSERRILYAFAERFAEAGI